eukprot:430600-Pyramimonas_sp.AAC.1
MAGRERGMASCCRGATPSRLLGQSDIYTGSLGGRRRASDFAFGPGLNAMMPQPWRARGPRQPPLGGAA